MADRKLRVSTRVGVSASAPAPKRTPVGVAQRSATDTRGARPARRKHGEALRETSAVDYGTQSSGRLVQRSEPSVLKPVRTANRETSLATRLATVAAQAASGQVRRKNMNLDQGLLDTVIAASGSTSETEAVRLGLAAYMEISAFEHAMLTGFDRVSSLSGFALASEAPINTAAFLARSENARKSRAR
jgi:hypothetical protein